MTKTSNPPDFYLHVCSSDCCAPAPAEVSVFGAKYPMNFRGKIPVAYRVESNILKFAIPELGYNPQLGEADEINSVVVRVCGTEVTVQALYTTPEKTALSACCHAGGCGCYGSVACAC